MLSCEVKTGSLEKFNEESNTRYLYENVAVCCSYSDKVSHVGDLNGRNLLFHSPGGY